MGKKLTVDNPAVYSLNFLEHIQFKNTNEIINIMLNVNDKEKKCFEDNQQNEPPKNIYSWNKFWVPKFNDIVRGRIIPHRNTHTALGTDSAHYRTLSIELTLNYMFNCPSRL